MNNEYLSGLYGTNLKYFQNMDDFDSYVEDDEKVKEEPNVALIEGYDDEEELGPDDVLLTESSNYAVWHILDDAGLIDDGVTYLTVADCAAFTDEDLYYRSWNYTASSLHACKQAGELTPTQGSSIFTYYNTFNTVDPDGNNFWEVATKWNVDQWSFNEFKYFTGITEIGPCFFLNCTGLTEISLPSSVVAIGQSAFDNCIKLRKCKIYNKESNVEMYITDDPIHIENAEEAGVDLIYAGGSAFGYAGAALSQPTNILFIDPNIDFVVAYNWVPNLPAEDEEPVSVITQRSNPNVYNILTASNYPHTGPNNGYTAADLAAITSITVSHNVIGSLLNNRMSIFSFYGNEEDNYNSSTFDIKNCVPYQYGGPNSPNYVESWTFNEFKYFTGLTSIPERCFHSCTTLTEITLPNTITSVESYAFHDCWSLEKFNTQGRAMFIDWDENALSYMSRLIVGDTYWDYLQDTVEDLLYYLGGHGVDIT